MSELPGRYVRLEGVDGAGKSTQLNLARKYSEAHDIDAVFVREPGGTNLGLDLRHILLTNRDFHLSPEVEFMLFTADRRHLWDTVIFPALRNNRPVISDRGIESSIAYQSAGGGVSMDTILEISSKLLDPRYIRPDALALLSLSKDARRQRLDKRFESVSADKIEDRDEEFSDRVYEGYMQLNTLEYAQSIDADRPAEEIFEELKPILFGKFLA